MTKKAEGKSVEKELMALETSYWQAIKDEDFERCLALTDDPCLVAGAQGVTSIGRDAFASMMKKSNYTINDFEVKDMQVRLLNDDVGIVGYKVREELTVDGKSVTIEASDASTWIKRDGHWVCALHTESLSGDPFGRDRTTTDRTEARNQAVS